eukprot:2938335-Prymnesium_polylepis.1
MTHLLLPQQGDLVAEIGEALEETGEVGLEQHEQLSRARHVRVTWHVDMVVGVTWGNVGSRGYGRGVTWGHVGSRGVTWGHAAKR